MVRLGQYGPAGRQIVPAFGSFGKFGPVAMPDRGASWHWPRNAAFMRQSGVRPAPCRINAAFRPTAALFLGAEPGCAPSRRWVGATVRNGRLKSEGRNPRPERRPNTETRIGLDSIGRSRGGVSVYSAFGFLSAFGSWVSGLGRTGPPADQPRRQFPWLCAALARPSSLHQTVPGASGWLPDAPSKAVALGEVLGVA